MYSGQIDPVLETDQWSKQSHCVISVDRDASVVAQDSKCMHWDLFGPWSSFCLALWLEPVVVCLASWIHQHVLSWVTNRPRLMDTGWHKWKHRSWPCGNTWQKAPTTWSYAYPRLEFTLTFQSMFIVLVQASISLLRGDFPFLFYGAPRLCNRVRSVGCHFSFK